MRILGLTFLLIVTGCTGATPNKNVVRTNFLEDSIPHDPPLNTMKVTLTSPDGARIVGSLYETFQPNSPAILLLHQWQNDRHSYDDFAKRMQLKHFNVLSIDARGFGESKTAADGSPIAAGRTDADVRAMLGDVGTAFEFLSKQKNVDPTRVGIAGASYGSSLAILYAADNPKVAAVALLSPRLNYFGNMPTAPAIRKYGDRPLYFLAGQDQDRESFDAVNKLNPIEGARAKYEQTIHPDGGHGTALLEVGAAEELDDFFSRHFIKGK